MPYAEGVSTSWSVSWGIPHHPDSFLNDTEGQLLNATRSTAIIDQSPSMVTRQRHLALSLKTAILFLPATSYG